MVKKGSIFTDAALRFFMSKMKLYRGFENLSFVFLSSD